MSTNKKDLLSQKQTKGAIGVRATEETPPNDVQDSDATYTSMDENSQKYQSVTKRKSFPTQTKKSITDIETKNSFEILSDDERNTQDPKKNETKIVPS